MKVVYQSAPKWSIHGTPPPPPPDSTPGPNQYSTQDLGTSKYRHQPSATLLARWKEAQASPTPGPGAYSTNPKPNTPSAVLLGRNSHHSARRLATPGPGQYNLPSEMNGCSQALLRPATSAPREPQPGVGPGSYDYDLARIKGQPHISIGKAPRADHGARRGPGPGEYSVEKTY
jgi:hypothetical protein